MAGKIFKSFSCTDFDEEQRLRLFNSSSNRGSWPARQRMSMGSIVTLGPVFDCNIAQFESVHSFFEYFFCQSFPPFSAPFFDTVVVQQLLDVLICLPFIWLPLIIFSFSSTRCTWCLSLLPYTWLPPYFLLFPSSIFFILFVRILCPDIL